MIDTITAPDRAAALRRGADKLGVALLALETFESRYVGRPPEKESDRRLLVDVAAQMLWEYVVQREMCGLVDQREILREYHVPREVWLRMGATPRPA